MIDQFRKFSIVMKSLYQGMSIQIPNQPYPLAMSENCNVGFLYAGGVIADIGVGCLMRMVESIPEDELIALAGSNALNEIREKNAN